MESGMTSDNADILKLTGKKIGKVYLGHDLKNKKTEYVAQTEGNRILDCGTGNFHLFPVLDNEDERKNWIDYQKKEKEIRETLQTKLQMIYPDAKWGSGCLRGIPKQYSPKLNRFFCYLQIKKNERYYTIFLKRFFVDKDNKVNCIYGDVQLISSTKKGPEELVNEFYGDAQKINTYSNAKKKEGYNCKTENVRKILVNYPKSYQGQNEKMIRLSGVNSVNVYNPEGICNIKDVSDKEQYVNKLLKIFNDYIRLVEKGTV